jgi:Dolichyl-phosphate-mannose-protein mannosyltransferase
LRPALVIFALALGLRLFFFAGIDLYPKFETFNDPGNDQLKFDEWAQAISRGEHYHWRSGAADGRGWADLQPGVFPMAPLYPALLGSFYRVFGVERDLWRLLQLVFGAAGCAAFFLWARFYLGSKWALGAALVFSFYGALIVHEVAFLRDAPAVAAVVFCLLGLELLRHRTTETWRWAHLAMGVGLGLTTLLRENLLLFALVAIVWLAWEKRSRQVLLWTGLGLLLALSPVLTLNAVRSGQLAFTSSSATYNLYIANVSTGTFWIPLPPPSFNVLMRQGPAEVDMLGLLVQDFKARPRIFLKYQVRKLKAFFHGWEIPNNLGYDQALALNPRLGLAFVRFHYLLPLALFGLSSLLWQPNLRRRFVLPWLYVVFAGGSLLPFSTLSRLRLILVPALVLLAFLGIRQLWSLGRARSFAKLSLVVLGSLGLSSLLAPPVLATTFVDRRMAANGLVARAFEHLALKRELEAEADLRRALALDPTQPELLGGLERLGLLANEEVDRSATAEIADLLGRNEPEKALRRLESYVAAHPGDEAARKALIVLLIELEPRP